MDWITLALIEVTFIEFLIILVLFIFSAKGKKKKFEDVPYKVSVKQVEKEAKAIVLAEKQMYRKQQPPRIKYQAPGPNYFKIISLFLLACLIDVWNGVKIVFSSIKEKVLEVHDRVQKEDTLRIARNERNRLREEALAKKEAEKMAWNAKLLKRKSHQIQQIKPKTKAVKEDEKEVKNIFVENIGILILFVLIAIGYELYRHLSSVSKLFSSLLSSWAIIPVVIILAAIILFFVYRAYDKSKAEAKK